MRGQAENSVAVIIPDTILNVLTEEIELDEGSDDADEEAAMIGSNFELRVSGNLTTQHALYNESMNRVDNPFRTTYFQNSFQGWMKMWNRWNAGAGLNWRSSVVDRFDSSPFEVFKFQTDSAADFYFRSLQLFARCLVYARKWNMVASSAFVVPVAENKTFNYSKYKFRDAQPAQLQLSLFLTRRYSKYFYLQCRLSSVYRINAFENTRSFTLRSGITPVFSYPLKSNLRFYAFTELSPIISGGFFSSFYFREAAGIAWTISRKYSSTLQYSYMALGKKNAALSTALLNVRYNFN